MPIIPAWGEVRPTITTKVVSSNSAHGEVYTIQHYVIKSVTSRRPVVFSSTIYIYIYEILLKVALNTITLIPTIIHTVFTTPW
jgi:hypothetical protein